MWRQAGAKPLTRRRSSSISCSIMACRQSAGHERSQGIDLFFAAAEGSCDAVRRLLQARVDPNFRDYEQRCPIHVAAGAKKGLEVVRLLLNARAQVDTTDKWGATPLEVAARAQHRDTEALLIAEGAKLPKSGLQTKAVLDKWEIRRQEVHISSEISRTMKSELYRATWNGIDVVAKFTTTGSADSTSEELEEEMLQEIAILATLRHPDLIMFLGCSLQESPIMFITQYMPGGDLEHLYNSRRVEGSPAWTPAAKVVNRWARCICRGLHFLHTCSETVIHRDLKPLNILLTESLDEVKLTDFGISKLAQHATDSYTMTGGVGTWRYMAPEVARHEAYTEKVDTYSFALILYFMSSGRQPFHEYADIKGVLDQYVAGKEPRPKASECPAEFRSIMEAAWDNVPDKRPSADVLMERLTDIHSGDRCAAGCHVM